MTLIMDAINKIKYPIILFDGVCNLCNNSVQFVIRNDTKEQFRFASLQSSFAQDLIRENIIKNTFNSFILIENGKVFTKSTAALRVLKLLGGKWKLIYAFILFPPFIRNGVYDIIANNRYRMFGKKELCWIPTPELRKLFLE
jgi:predicted DCC family thiol-disulfide oxidoreductase YuxK